MTLGHLGEPRVYGLHGLRLRSPVPLAGFSLPDGHVDIDVTWARPRPVPTVAPAGRTMLATAAGDRLLYVAVDDGQCITLRVLGICDFLVDRESFTVECRPDPGTDLRFVAVLVAGLVVAFLLTISGDCVLHASAVEVEGAAVAFAGPSGAGKSTLAALLCGAGARLVSDDLLRLTRAPRVACVGGSPQIRLRPGATWALDHFVAHPPNQDTVDHRLAISPPPVVDDCVALSVIVLPRLSRDATAVDVRPVAGSAAVTSLAGACRVVGWKDPDILRAQFRTLVRVAAGVPVVEAVIPWRQSSRESIVPALLDLARTYR